MSATLIVGTYPPIPLPAAAATVAAVKEAWDAGDEVTVVSPRMSAAHLAVAVAGPLAGRRLANVQRHTSTDRLVLVLEPGFPVPAGTRWKQWATVVGLARSLRRFEHVTVVTAGDLGKPEHYLASRAGRVVEFPVSARLSPGVTPLGPREVLPREFPRYLAGKALRLVRGFARRTGRGLTRRGSGGTLTEDG